MENRHGLDQVQADKYLSAGYTIIAIDSWPRTWVRAGHGRSGDCRDV